MFHFFFCIITPLMRLTNSTTLLMPGDKLKFIDTYSSFTADGRSNELKVALPL